MISSDCGWSQLLLHLQWYFLAEMTQIRWSCLSGIAICWKGKQSSVSAGEGGDSKWITHALCFITQKNARIKEEVGMENIHVLREVGQNGAWASGSVRTGKCWWKHLTRSMQLPFGEAVVRNPCNFTTNTEEWVNIRGNLSLISLTRNNGLGLSAGESTRVWVSWYPDPLQCMLFAALPSLSGLTVNSLVQVPGLTTLLLLAVYLLVAKFRSGLCFWSKYPNFPCYHAWLLLISNRYPAQNQTGNSIWNMYSVVTAFLAPTFWSLSTPFLVCLDNVNMITESLF